jgi:hypothetical protein
MNSVPPDIFLTAGITLLIVALVIGSLFLGGKRGG